MHNKTSPTRPKRNGNLCIRQCCMQSKAAMSLMEISIVIIILGLLTTAIIGGASIRKMAGQKHLVSSINAMTQSLLLFKQTYGYWPGDFPNANEVFGPMSKISAKCPIVDSNGVAGTITAGVAGNGDGLIGTAEDATPVKDWGSETMFMACHMVLAQLAPSTVNGSGLRINQNVNINLTTSPTHSSFGGEKVLHIPTYSSSFLTYGSTNTGLPAVQINSNKDIHKELLPFIMLAKSNRSLDVHIQDIFLAEAVGANQKKDFKVKPQATQTAAIALRRYAAAIASSLYSTAEAADDACSPSRLGGNDALEVCTTGSAPTQNTNWQKCYPGFITWARCFRLSGFTHDVELHVAGKMRGIVGNGSCICGNVYQVYYVMNTPRIDVDAEAKAAEAARVAAEAKAKADAAAKAKAAADAAAKAAADAAAKKAAADAAAKANPPVNNPASATLTDPPSSHLSPTHIYLPVSDM